MGTSCNLAFGLTADQSTFTKKERKLDIHVNIRARNKQFGMRPLTEEETQSVFEKLAK